jgi:hypothetical protein
MDDQTPPRQPQPQSDQPPQTPVEPPVTPTPFQEVEPSTLNTDTPVGPSHPDVFIPPFYQPPAPKKSHKKRWAIIISVILVVLIGGAAAAYTFWYQHPEKVVTDGIVHAMQAKSTQYTGSMAIDAGTSKVKVELTGASVASAQDLSAKVTFPAGGKDITVEGDAMFDGKSDLYVKLKNVKDLTAPLRSEMDALTRKTFDKVVAKVDNQWVKIAVEDLVGFNESAAKVQKCFGEAMTQYANDATISAEITDAYKKNKFVLIDQNLGTKDGSLGYTLTGDTAKAKAFIVDLKNTKLYKSLYACDNGFKIDENELVPNDPAKEGATSRVEVWVSQWTHEITKVSANNTTTNADDTSTKVETMFEPKFNTGVTIEPPAQSITLDQLKADIETLTKEAQASQKSAVRLKA